ncbi:cytochrome c-type biogenesis protein [Paraglaciecola sp.]|uniref:cytochrome c-type biogenesis protein n=1 Tax=Paraglaciecola sp. TaxID=1920173 RepID=UPI003EF5C4FD
MFKPVLIILGFLFTITSSMAMEDKFKFDDPKQTALFLELTKVLRCPKCQNQNIADSDAMIAVDLKRKVHELVKKGQTKQQVVDFMKQRYGDFVFYEPPVNSMTIWLWLLPLFFVVGTLSWIVRSRKKSVPQIDNSQLKKAQEILEREE